MTLERDNRAYEGLLEVDLAIEMDQDSGPPQISVCFSAVTTPSLSSVFSVDLFHHNFTLLFCSGLWVQGSG
jgi:hypothetical protein